MSPPRIANARDRVGKCLPSPWRRGTYIDLEDGGYMTRSRCKTGYKIKRCCSRCTMWELWHNGLPLPEERCTTWEEARDRFIALTCGRHDRLALGMGACRVAVRRPGGRHRPAKGTWDASWLLFPQTYVLGAEHEPIPYALV